MVTPELFDIFAYFKEIGAKNKLANEKEFKTVFCSGPESIEGVMQDFTRVSNFIMVDDTSAQNTFSTGVTYFKKDVYTVFVIAAYRYDDMSDREQKLNLCRRIFRQIHSKMLHDKETRKYGDLLDFLHVERIYAKEIGRYAMNGVTGLYFMVENEQPIEIEYDDTEWQP